MSKFNKLYIFLFFFKQILLFILMDGAHHSYDVRTFSAQPISGVRRDLDVKHQNNGGCHLQQTLPCHHFRCHGVHGAVRGGGGRSDRRRESRRFPPEVGRGREEQTAAGGRVESSRGEAV